MENFTKAYIATVGKNDITHACALLTKGLNKNITQENLIRWRDSRVPPRPASQFMLQSLMIYYFEVSGVKFTKKTLLQVLELSSSKKRLNN